MPATDPTPARPGRMDGPTDPRPAGRGPQRPPPRRVRVHAIEQLSSRLVAITFAGEALAGFGPPAPTAHIKVFLPDAAGHLAEPVVGPRGLEWPDGRPTMRTYTPRRFDAEALTLEVVFVLHGHGPAAQWAARAQVGDLVGIGGPGGRFALEPETDSWWIGGDESALPAIATLIEALPATARAVVHLEVSGAEDRLPMPEHPGVSLVWHERGADGIGHELTAALTSALIEADRDPTTHFWVATEALAVRDLRRQLLDFGVPAAQITTRGYWRVGEANHPDHDFGDD